MEQAWSATVTKADLLNAIGYARTARLLRSANGTREKEVVFIGQADGLSVRSSAVATLVPYTGCWTSPVAANGPMLRRLGPKLAGPQVTLRYEAGRLFVNGTSVPAREF